MSALVRDPRWPRGLEDPLPIPAGFVAGGRLAPPPSKSYSHRYLNLSLLRAAPTRIERLLEAEDIGHFLTAVRALVENVDRDATGVAIGGASRPSGAQVRPIYCGNAGTMYRFLVATLTTLEGRFVVDGTARLRERPIAALVTALRQLGAEIQYRRQPGFAPLDITGSSLAGGRCRVDASESSQYLSALLMAATRARSASTIEVVGLSSAPYVDVTLDAMASFGVADRVEERASASGSRSFVVTPRADDAEALELRVEGDFSAAAYPAAAAAITAGRVELAGLRRDSPQGDRRFFDLLEEVGVEIDWGTDSVVVRGRGRLQALDVDLSSMPDQVPTLAAIAAFCDGTTTIRNVPHLRIKESDRLAAMASELQSAGVEVEERDDGLVIHGQPEGPAIGSGASDVVIDSHDDHRIAMSLALVGLRRPGLRIAAPEVVAKSYPAFWSDFFSLVAAR